LIELGFSLCKADPDVWLRPTSKACGFEYYEYIFTYVDDCLIISDQPKLLIDILHNEYNYRLKDVGTPTRYLGAQIGKYTFDNGTHSWFMSSQL